MPAVGEYIATGPAQAISKAQWTEWHFDRLITGLTGRVWVGLQSYSGVIFPSASMGLKPTPHLTGSQPCNLTARHPHTLSASHTNPQPHSPTAAHISAWPHGPIPSSMCPYGCGCVAPCPRGWKGVNGFTCLWGRECVRVRMARCACYFAQFHATQPDGLRGPHPNSPTPSAPLPTASRNARASASGNMGWLFPTFRDYPGNFWVAYVNTWQTPSSDLQTFVTSFGPPQMYARTVFNCTRQLQCSGVCRCCAQVYKISRPCKHLVR